MLQPAVVVNTGTVAAPPKLKLGAVVPLKFMVPVLVTDMVPLPLPNVIELPKVMLPVLTVITSVATAVLPIHVTVPFTVKAPVVTATLPTQVAVLPAPLKTRLPVTLQTPALTAS